MDAHWYVLVDYYFASLYHVSHFPYIYFLFPLADHLYAGCTTGSVLCGSIDKENVSEVWNAVVEKSDFVDEDEDHQITISIRKLQWLAPQAPSTDGCLFALLGATSGTSSETLKSVIVGLAAVNTHNGGLDQVLSIPPSINGKQRVFLLSVYAFVIMLPSHTHSNYFLFLMIFCHIVYFTSLMLVQVKR